MMSKHVAGILGGMGPLATVDFMRKVVALNPAEFDQQHLNCVIVSDPSVPDRVGPIVRGKGESPLEALVRGVKKLEQSGATYIAMPCHTAHYWYDDIMKHTDLPFIHMGDAVIDDVRSKVPADGKVGLLATMGTLKANLYQPRLQAAGYEYELPTDEEMELYVLPAIALVKQDRLEEAGEHLESAVARLCSRGACTVLLACTELPLAQTKEIKNKCIDATESLARATIDYYYS